MKNNILIVIVIISNLFLFLKELHIFQLNYYKLDKQITYCVKNYKKIILNMIINLLILKLIDKLFLVIILFIIFIKLNLSKLQKKKLVYTKKVIRYFVFAFIIALFITIHLSYKIILMLNIIIDLELLLIDLINKPMNNLINAFYIRNAKNKLKKYKNLNIVGITGSYGKTSVKNYLYTFLSTRYNVLKTPKNYNTDLGIVKTIRSDLDNIHEIFIVEMGATKNGDINKICDIVKPNISIITNIGKMHLDSFKTEENILNSKFEIFENSSVVFANIDDKKIKNNIPMLNDKKIITFSSKYSEADYFLFDINSLNGKTKFKIKYDNKIVEFETKLLGIHNIYNVFMALAIADYYKVDITKLNREVYNLKNIKHRLELKKVNNMLIIDDSYNSNEIGSKNALDVLKSFEGYKIVVTPGMVELGSEENKINYRFGTYIADSCDEVILTNVKNTKYIFEALKNKNFNNIRYIEKIDKVFDYIQKIDKNNVVVLLENDLPDQYY